MAANKSNKGIIILILLCVLALLLSGFCLIPVLILKSNILSGNSTMESIVNTGKNVSKSDSYVAVINISGVIQEKGPEYNQQWLLTTIEKCKKDNKNKAILLYVSSPGGTVYHSDEAYLALLDYKKSGKKVYAYFSTMAASGGYYIACSADKIYANRNCLTGSIGVISASTIDATELMNKIGIKSITIHAGKNKNMLNYNEPVTKEQIQIMQSLADETYDQFTSIVAESRHMPMEIVRKLADGRIYSAKQARENGLIDEVVPYPYAKQLIAADFADQSLSFKTFKYNKPDNLRSILMEGISIIKNPQASFAQGPVLSYLYTGN